MTYGNAVWLGAGFDGVGVPVYCGEEEGSKLFSCPIRRTGETSDALHCCWIAYDFGDVGLAHVGCCGMAHGVKRRRRRRGGSLLGGMGERARR